MKASEFATTNRPLFSLRNAQRVEAEIDDLVRPIEEKYKKYIEDQFDKYGLKGLQYDAIHDKVSFDGKKLFVDMNKYLQETFVYFRKEEIDFLIKENKLLFLCNKPDSIHCDTDLDCDDETDSIVDMKIHVEETIYRLMLNASSGIQEEREYVLSEEYFLEELEKNGVEFDEHGIELTHTN